MTPNNRISEVKKHAESAAPSKARCPIETMDAQTDATQCQKQATLTCGSTLEARFQFR